MNTVSYVWYWRRSWNVWISFRNFRKIKVKRIGSSDCYSSTTIIDTILRLKLIVSYNLIINYNLQLIFWKIIVSNWFYFIIKCLWCWLSNSNSNCCISVYSRKPISNYIKSIRRTISLPLRCAVFVKIEIKSKRWIWWSLFYVRQWCIRHIKYNTWVSISRNWWIN